MKKKCKEQWCYKHHVFGKLLTIMKLTTLFFLLAILHVTASESYSQSTRLTMRFSEKSLSEVFNQIEQNSEFSIFYSNELLKNTGLKSGIFDNQQIFDVLNQVLQGEKLTYSIKGKIIMIVPEEENQQGTMVSSQQARTVEGKVTDSGGQPLPGVTVVVKGTTNGTITDFNGNYTLGNVPENGTLVFSFVGMRTQEMVLAGRSTVNVTMVEDAIGIEEVVAVGYGTMRKKDLTGSITQIRPDRLSNENPKTVQDILRGTPGLQVGYDPSAKGGGSMQIRGQRSVYTGGGHNEPLIVLDGMIFYGELSEINPDDIEQIKLQLASSNRV